MSPLRPSLPLAAVAGVLGGASMLHPPSLPAPRRDLLPTAADLDRIEAAAARRARRAAKRVRAGRAAP